MKKHRGWLLPLMLALIFMSASPGLIRAGLSEDYGYPLTALRQAVNGANTYAGWTEANKEFTSPEIDLSTCANPHLFSRLYTNKAYISNDGINYQELKFPSTSDYVALPKDTRYIRVAKGASDEIPHTIVVADIPYGTANLSDICNNISAVTGSYDPATNKYTFPDATDMFTGTVRIELEPAKWASALRGLELSSTSVIDNITAVRSDGKRVVCDAMIDGKYLLPADAVYLELGLSSHRNTTNLPTLKCITFTAKFSAENPSSQFSQYYDIDGDGLLEYCDYIIYRPVTTPDGLMYIKGNDRRIRNICGINTDGHIYFESSTEALQRIDNIDAEAETLYQAPLFDGGYQRNLFITPIDYNLDGQPDYYYTQRSNGYSTSLLTICPDGTATNVALDVMTPAEYAGVRSELKLSTGGEGIPGVTEEMFGRDGATVTTFGTASVVDINSDGLPDFIDASTGHYFLNTGDGSFVESTYGDRVTFRDFDGDGINDILRWEYSAGNVKLYPGGETTKEPLLLFNAMRLCNVFCRDIDNDGDVDVVALITKSKNTEDSYIVISENQGNGKFRRREHFLAEGIDFLKNVILDIDGDGKYEVFGTKYSGNPYEGYMIKIESPAQVSVSSLFSQDSYKDDFFPVRIDANGPWMLYMSEAKSPFKTFNAGSRPDKPTAPTLVYDAAQQRLSVSWEPGHDKETPTVDLTYEVRIGTAPGLADIAVAQALPDGTRRNLLAGTNGYSTHTVYNVESWPEGKIYISYQVIDDSFTGSEFSEPAVFEKQTPPSGFVFSAPESFGVWCEATASPTFQHPQGTTCEWDFADGELLSLDPVTNVAKVRFTTPGTKTITLTTAYADGVASTTSKTVYVEPMYFVEKSSSPIFISTLDIDGDGLAEGFASGQFYQENGDGVYETYKKSFNTATGISEPVFADVDGDGFADVVDGANFLINYGDGDMEKMTKPLSGNKVKWTIHDFNNDGKLDPYASLNSGDYLSAEDPGWNLNPPIASYGWTQLATPFYYDFNGDGLIDIAYMGGTGGMWGSVLPLHIFENIDGHNFKPGREVSDITIQPSLIDDIDGDGNADIVLCNATYSFGVTSYDEYITVIWGSGATPTKIQCPDGNPFRSVDSCFDFNNDGIKDISVSLQSGYGIITINADKSTCFTPTADNMGDVVARRRDGNLRMIRNTLLAAPNERPTPPTEIRASQTDRAMVLEWNPGTDKETPATALRYNIAIKHKGASGEGAYLISPLNGCRNDIPVPMPARLLTSTKFTIPMQSIPAGEYEVCIQSVDTQHDAGDFSEVFNLTVHETALVELPTSGMIDSPVEMKLLTNIDSPVIDYGPDATVGTSASGATTVQWSTTGLKEIKVNGQPAASIYIYPAIDAAFTLPQSIAAGSLVTIPSATAAKGSWEILPENDEWESILNSDIASIEFIGENDLSVRFLKEGSFTIRHTVSEDYGTAVYEQLTKVEESTVAIDFITAQDNHHKILWTQASAPSDATAVRIYREGARYNVFDCIDEVPVTSGEYIDLKSDATIKTARYKIGYVMPYGCTALSDAHQPMHVQVNRGIGSAINLSWSRYEGTEIESYRILKGNTPDALDIIDVVSGHHTSFTDTSDDASTSYYSIEAVPAVPHTARLKAAGRAFDQAPRSNVVNGAQAAAIILATEVLVSTIDGNTNFDGRLSIQLQARMLPATASITKVNWEVVSGADIMKVDNYGNVIPMAIGNAVIRARAVDGSEAFGDIELCNNEIPLTWIEFTAWPENHQLAKGDSFQYQIKAEPVNATEKPVWESSDPTVATVTPDGTVHALNEGYTTIKVSTANPELWIDLGLTVVRPADYIEVSAISLTPEVVRGLPGTTHAIVADVLPANASDKRITWSIEPYESSVADVDDEGVVSINATGVATVIARSVSNPDVMATATVTGISSIDEILTNDNISCDVYSLSGILIRRAATRADIHKLTPGFYIVTVGNTASRIRVK